MRFDFDKLMKIYQRNNFLTKDIQMELKEIIDESGWCEPDFSGDQVAFYKRVECKPKNKGKRNRKISVFVYMYKDGIKICQTRENLEKKDINQICEEISRLIFVWTKYGYIK